MQRVIVAFYYLRTHTHTHTHRRTSLDEVSARRWGLSLHNKQHLQETNMGAPPAGFEPANQAV